VYFSQFLLFLLFIFLIYLLHYQPNIHRVSNRQKVRPDSRSSVGASSHNRSDQWTKPDFHHWTGKECVWNSRQEFPQVVSPRPLFPASHHKTNRLCMYRQTSLSYLTQATTHGHYLTGHPIGTVTSCYRVQPYRPQTMTMTATTMTAKDITLWNLSNDVQWILSVVRTPYISGRYGIGPRPIVTPDLKWAPLKKLCRLLCGGFFRTSLSGAQQHC